MYYEDDNTVEGLITLSSMRGGWWPGGRASDSVLRGHGFNPHSGHPVVPLSNPH